MVQNTLHSKMTKKREDQSGSEHKKGLWTVEEDKLLSDYVNVHGKGQWNRIAKNTGKLVSDSDTQNVT